MWRGRTVSKSVLTMISILQLPGRGVACSLSALTTLRGVDAWLAMSASLMWPFISVAAGCSASVLTAASLVVTPLLDRAKYIPATNPAAAAAPKATT